ncbi:hypothetical protein Zm00014a_022970 [Zea mays]|uniref:Uncharacterized protein n=1 Tax=Zea mays TaxID=4577 RepID=A0A3L6DTW4_MAIZE|nr:hypothetical protein Zm00014a_022970 [Zea mays]
MGRLFSADQSIEPRGKDHGKNIKVKRKRKRWNLGGKRVIPLRRPEPSADVAVGGGDAAEHGDEEPDGVVSDVDGEGPARARDGDAAPRALGQVDVVHPGARGDDAAEGGDGVQERGVDQDGAAGHHERGARGLRFRRGGGEEGPERRARGVQVVDAEARPQRGGEVRVRAAQEEDPWLGRGRG